MTTKTTKSPRDKGEKEDSKPATTETTPSSRAVLREVIFAAVEESELLDLGRAYDSGDLLDLVPEFQRSVVETWAALPDARKALLVGFDPELEALLGDEREALASLKARLDHQSGEGAASRAKHEAAARKAHGEGVLLRDQAFRALRRFVKADAAALAELDEAVGLADSPANLARGLDQVAKLLRAHRASASQTVRSAMDTLKVGEALAAELTAMAERVRTTSQAASDPREQLQVTQRTLDLQDGRVLYLTRMIYEAFRSAHHRDPTLLLPRTPGVLGRLVDSRARSSSKAKQAPQPPKPA